MNLRFIFYRYFSRHVFRVIWFFGDYITNKKKKYEDYKFYKLHDKEMLIRDLDPNNLGDRAWYYGQILPINNAIKEYMKLKNEGNNMKIQTTVMVPNGENIGDSIECANMPIEFSNDGMAAGIVSFTVGGQTYAMPADEMANIAYFLRNNGEDL